jgi:pre-mRNA-splicing factor 18
MDFASLMKSQIAASKPKSSSSTSPSTDSPPAKYLKRSEVEEARQAQYLADQVALEALRQEKAAKKRKHEEETREREKQREEKRRKLAEESRKQRQEAEEKEERERRKRLGLPELPKIQEAAAEAKVEEELDEELPSEDEILKVFREKGEAIRLFGESNVQRNTRFLNLVSPSPFPDPLPIPTTIRLVPESQMKVPAILPTSPKARYLLRRQLASYFTLLLFEWADALASRSQDVKESSTGRAAYNSMLSAKSDLIPLFRRLEANEVDDAVLTGILEIIHDAQERLYVDANKKYLLLSIGKAAWPIGVTMVGIHERSAREKLHETDKTAHIMTDEITRRFLQSIKRCLSFAQTRWPPDDLLQLMG